MGRGQAKTTSNDISIMPRATNDGPIRIEQQLSTYLRYHDQYSLLSQSEQEQITQQWSKLDWNVVDELAYSIQDLNQPLTKSKIEQVIFDSIAEAERENLHAWDTSKMQLGYLWDKSGYNNWQSYSKRASKFPYFYDRSTTKIEQAAETIRQAGAILRDAMDASQVDRYVQHPETVGKGKEAASDLGAAIPESKFKFDLDSEGQRVSVGEYNFDFHVEERFSVLRNAMERGQRVFALYGAPGSGKSATAEQYAAIKRRPHITLGIGGDGGRKDKLEITSADGKTNAWLIVEQGQAKQAIEALEKSTVVEFEQNAVDPQQAANAQSIIAAASKNGQSISCSMAGENSEITVGADVFFTFTQWGNDDPRLSAACNEQTTNLKCFATFKK